MERRRTSSRRQVGVEVVTVDFAGAGIWRLLRALRANLPSEERWAAHRRLTFWAALEQGEQLWAASSAVGISARPLPLFYGLTQVGLALSAARHPRPNEFEFPAGHGLHCTCPNGRSDVPPKLDEATVTPRGAGGIHRVAEVLGSPVLVSGVTLHELACSLPESDAFLLDEDSSRRALPVQLRMTDHNPAAVTDELRLTVGPLPDSLIKAPAQEPSPEDLIRLLSAYPTLAAVLDTTAAVETFRFPSSERNEFCHYATVPIRLSRSMTGAERFAHAEKLLDVVQERTIGDYPRGHNLPALGGNGTVMDPLVTWWLLLFGFSIWARYHPRSWTSLINTNTSPQAVTVEMVLEAAAEIVPRIILHEIISRPATP